MTSIDSTVPAEPAKRRAPAMGFGTHRQEDRPASALRAGATRMPAPWQNRGTPQAASHHKYGAPVRSFGEILSAPLTRVMTHRPAKIALGGVVVVAILTLVF